MHKRHTFKTKFLIATLTAVTSLTALAYDAKNHAVERTAFEQKSQFTLMPVNESVSDARLRFIREYQAKMEPMNWRKWMKKKDELSKQQFETGLKKQADKLFTKDSYSTAEFEQRMLQDFDDDTAKMQAMNDKQTKVRFGIIDYDKDGLMDIGEFQRTGLKSFDRYDASGDGVIDASDKTLFEADQQLINKNNRKRIQRLIQLNSQHSITGFLNRYQENGDALTQADYLAHREKHFKKTDANGDGRVDVTEYTNEFNGRLAQAKREGRSRYQGYLKPMTQTVDANQDGTVTKAEYTAYITNAFNAFDSNADGRLDVRDAY